MNGLFIALGLGSVTALAHAQGTIVFANSALTRVRICTDDNRAYRNAPPGIEVVVGVWYGPSADALIRAPGTASVSSGSGIMVAGIMVGASSAYALPGTEPGQTVALQIRAWNDMGWYGETKVEQVTLGLTDGPGTVIWQTASGVNPNRFTPLFVECPEPSTLVLGMLACVSLLFRLRKATDS